MRGIASGESVGEIAARMHLSVKTVSTYRTRLLEKMGMDDQRRAHALRDPERPRVGTPTTRQAESA